MKSLAFLRVKPFLRELLSHCSWELWVLQGRTQKRVRDRSGWVPIRARSRCLWEQTQASLLVPPSPPPSSHWNTILSPLKKREVSWFVDPRHPPDSGGDEVGGFPLAQERSCLWSTSYLGSKEKPRSAPAWQVCQCHSVNISGWEWKSPPGRYRAVNPMPWGRDLTRLGLYLLSSQPAPLFQKSCACSGWLP